MHKLTKCVWFLTILCFLLGCNEAAEQKKNSASNLENKIEAAKVPEKVEPQTDIYTQAANETCQCMQPLLEKAKHLKELETNKDVNEMKKVASEMATMQPQIQKCSDTIKKKYSKIDNAVDEKRIRNALLKVCPDFKALL